MSLARLALSLCAAVLLLSFPGAPVPFAASQQGTLEGEYVLAVDLQVRGERVRILRTEVLAGGLPKRTGLQAGSMTLQLGGPDGELLHAQSFEPVLTLVPPPPRAGEAHGAPVRLRSLRTTAILPWLPESRRVRLLDATGAQLDAATITRLPTRLPAARAARATRIWDSGPDADSMVLLVMGDAYKGADKRRYRADAAAHTVDFMLDVEPFAAARDNINIYRASNRKGLKCKYGCGGIDRLICCNASRVFKRAARSRVPYDEILVLVNDTRYGGSGGVSVGGGGSNSYATAYNRYGAGDAGTGGYAWGREVSVHELGHSFFGLMDEYEYDRAGSAWGPNCAAAPCPWSGAGLGCWSGCSYDGLSRPTEAHCLMRTLTPSQGLYEFCAVGREQGTTVLARY